MIRKCLLICQSVSPGSFLYHFYLENQAFLWSLMLSAECMYTTQLTAIEQNGIGSKAVLPYTAEEWRLKIRGKSLSYLKGKIQS